MDQEAAAAADQAAVEVPILMMGTNHSTDHVVVLLSCTWVPVHGLEQIMDMKVKNTCKRLTVALV